MNTPTAAPASRSARRRLCAALLAGAALLGSAAAAAATPARIVIQFSHVVAPDTAKGRAALRFKQLAEARSGGRVLVEVHPDSELYKDREELQALQLGAVQMLAPALGKLGGEFEVFDLPFLFKSHAAFRAVADAPIGRAMLGRLAARGIEGLAYWDNGFKVMTSRRPLHQAADFQGLNVRVQSSHVLVAQMRALGAHPVVLPLSEIYPAARDGLIDAEESIPSNILSQRVDEVQSNLTVSNHGYLAYAVIVNKAFWDGLPDDVRSILTGALKDATAYEDGLAEAENAQALAQIRRRGHVLVYTPTVDELAGWKAAMHETYEPARAWIAPATLAAVQKAAGAGP